MDGIILVGEPGSGKTTIAQEVCNILGWERKSFAQAVKVEAAIAIEHATRPRIAWSQIVEQMNDVATKDHYRLLLQWWGTDFRREQNESYWLDRLREMLAASGHYVVDDCRFNNEYAMLKTLGFKLVRLDSGETTRPVNDHSSEVDWKLWPPDLVLNYEPGPLHQASRIVAILGLTPAPVRLD